MQGRRTGPRHGETRGLALRQRGSGVGHVAGNLRLELVERPELLLVAQARDEVDSQARVVEVAVEIEEVRLDREPACPRPWGGSRCS